MKTTEEVNKLQEEVESLKKELAELTDEELKQIYGGNVMSGYQYDSSPIEDKCYAPPTPGPTPTPCPPRTDRG